MSWSYTVHQINHALEQMAFWYRDFMQRTEQSFRALHQRLMYLEEREAWQGPTDEQLERVLRKILAEKFSSTGSHKMESPHTPTSAKYFVETPNENASVPTAIPINMAILQVDPAAVPSRQYKQTLEMLENDIVDYPNVDLAKNTQRDSVHDINDNSAQFKRPRQPASQKHSKQWA